MIKSLELFEFVRYEVIDEDDHILFEGMGMNDPFASTSDDQRFLSRNMVAGAKQAQAVNQQNQANLASFSDIVKQELIKNIRETPELSKVDLAADFDRLPINYKRILRNVVNKTIQDQIVDAKIAKDEKKMKTIQNFMDLHRGNVTDLLSFFGIVPIKARA